MSPSADAGSKKRKRDAGDSGKHKNEKRGRKTKLGVKPSKSSKGSATNGAAASGEFISLDIPGESDAAPKQAGPLSKAEVRAVAKEKRRAPRNIRKEKRAAKAAAAGAARKERERLEALAAEDGDEGEEGAEAGAEAQDGQAEGEEDGVAATPAPAVAKAPKEARFIIFVGNLPYTATKESLAAHFKSVAPDHIRLMTDKKTQKPKGYAFIEFNHYDRMKSCLKLYHHSKFDDGTGGDPREINVELTVGGGGGGKERKKKILKKNSKLADERRRRLREEFKQKKEKEAAAGGNAEQGDLHPSRRQFVKS